MSEWYEARQEAMGEFINEQASEHEDYGYCPDCEKVYEEDVYRNVVEKIDIMIEAKKRIQEMYLNDPKRDDRYLRYSLLQEQIDALKELKEVLW